MTTFEQAMAAIKKRAAAEEKREAERPLKEFTEAGIKAGFSSMQCEFMWKELAKEYHRHWDGRIG